MNLSIIILNYNTFELTCQCIESINKFTRSLDYEIIVVDNASPSEDPKKIKLQFPKVKLIENQENLGFAKGNNLGIKYAKGEYILLLNSDTYQTYDCIDNIYKIISNDDKIGIISPQLKFPDGSIQWTGGDFPSVKNELIFLTGLYKLKENNINKIKNCVEIEMLTGAFMMFKKQNLEKLEDGKLYDKFFMYSEDLVWSYQFSILGLKNILYQSEFIYHIKGGANFISDQKVSFFHGHIDNEIRFIREFYSTNSYKTLLLLRFIRFNLLSLLKPKNKEVQNLSDYYRKEVWKIK